MALKWHSFGAEAPLKEIYFHKLNQKKQWLFLTNLQGYCGMKKHPLNIHWHWRELEIYFPKNHSFERDKDY